MMTLQEAISTIVGYKQDILFLRSVIAVECPTTLKAIKLIDNEYSTVKKPKGYNLVKRNNKKLGFVYYVRYWHNGEMLSSKWCTHTNDELVAGKFAEENRDRLINGYLKKNGGEVVRFFRNFYYDYNPIYQSECRRSSELSEAIRTRYLAIMQDNFVPFLKERRIQAFDEITVPLLDDFQDTLLTKGIKSKTANDQIGALSRIFKYLTRKGLIKDNPYIKLDKLPVKIEEKNTHGCYELDIMKGIFNKRWKEKLSYLLNLIIHTTDMRNCEIKRFCKKDIIYFSKCRFIDVKESKTENGLRLVPIHNTVYKKIMAYAKDLDDETPIFGKSSNYQFTKASRELGKMLKINEEFRRENNITFYSGRHFWKTLMSSEGLGEDIEEVFMGHKVSGDVAKLYNHRDKLGKKLYAKKAKQVFAILDRQIFTTRV